DNVLMEYICTLFGILWIAQLVGFEWLDIAQPDTGLDEPGKPGFCRRERVREGVVSDTGSSMDPLALSRTSQASPGSLLQKLS
ncbi:hypothetical protein, partial [Pseudomonas syringae]|uniref:hypothetical protein n=1 Tax=Pseudomonas syringae TaxID=317 RepID=UPI001F1F5BEA